MDMEMFMAGQGAAIEDTEFNVSDRYKDKEGKTVLWKLRPISGDAERGIKAACFKDNKFDNIKYSEMIAAETVVYPNLGNGKLQDSYRVMGKTSLLNKMLLAGEKNRLILKALEINGLNISTEELAKDVKNV